MKYVALKKCFVEGIVREEGEIFESDKKIPGPAVAPVEEKTEEKEKPAAKKKAASKKKED